ncbi:MAG: DUF2306 domain-containing protein [Actinomycetia bacterium]|nr:DUF2306 domain-containing protein [Actinomycetes bacterium]
MERTLYARPVEVVVPQRRPSRRSWAVPVGLVALGIVPMVAGALRIVELGGGPALTHNDPRFTATPLPVIVHVVSGVAFSVAGAFQVSSAVRRRWPKWHRTAGRVLLPTGLVAGVSALWLTVALPWAGDDGWTLYLLRLGFGAAMVGALVLGAVELGRRRYREHGAWMLRGYAIGAAAGTQALISLPVAIVAEAPTGLLRAALLGAGWVINLAVAEWVIQRRRSAGLGGGAGRRWWTPPDIHRARLGGGLGGEVSRRR